MGKQTLVPRSDQNDIYVMMGMGGGCEWLSAWITDGEIRWTEWIIIQSVTNYV